MKRGIIRHMRFLAMLMVLPLTAFGRTLTVPPLPPSEFADTEVSTNIPLSVTFAGVACVNVSLSFVATPTNGLEVALGIDADCDGNLSVGESSYVLGYDCGRWFVREVLTDSVLTEPVDWDADGEDGEALGDAGMRVEKAFAIERRDIVETWDALKVSRRGLGASGERVSVRTQTCGFLIMIE